MPAINVTCYTPGGLTEKGIKYNDYNIAFYHRPNTFCTIFIVSIVANLVLTGAIIYFDDESDL